LKKSLLVIAATPPMNGELVPLLADTPAQVNMSTSSSREGGISYHVDGAWGLKKNSERKRKEKNQNPVGGWGE
jgi:hypothetical protein